MYKRDTVSGTYIHVKCNKVAAGSLHALQVTCTIVRTLVLPVGTVGGSSRALHCLLRDYLQTGKSGREKREEREENTGEETSERKEEQHSRTPPPSVYRTPK